MMNDIELYTVPADMSHEEWKKEFVAKTDESGIISLRLNRVAHLGDAPMDEKRFFK